VGDVGGANGADTQPAGVNFSMTGAF